MTKPTSSDQGLDARGDRLQPEIDGVAALGRAGDGIRRDGFESHEGLVRQAFVRVHLADDPGARERC